MKSNAIRAAITLYDENGTTIYKSKNSDWNLVRREADAAINRKIRQEEEAYRRWQRHQAGGGRSR